ncbi:PP2C family protein-serine/threonine phosphatase, partial [Rhizobium lemnae]
PDHKATCKVWISLKAFRVRLLEARLHDLRGKLARANSLLRSRNAALGRPVSDAVSIAVLLLDVDSFVALWCGDTRCYLLRDGMLRCLTRDHVQIGMKRSLTRAVGLNAVLQADQVADDLRENDQFLICNAPLTCTLSERTVAEIMLSEQVLDVPRSLVENALIDGCTDNLTSLIVHVSAD